MQSVLNNPVVIFFWRFYPVVKLMLEGSKSHFLCSWYVFNLISIFSKKNCRMFHQSYCFVWFCCPIRDWSTHIVMIRMFPSVCIRCSISSLTVRTCCSWIWCHAIWHAALRYNTMIVALSGSCMACKWHCLHALFTYGVHHRALLRGVFSSFLISFWDI
jgi:hypothetical protein